jgi:hypothetical protein
LTSSRSSCCPTPAGRADGAVLVKMRRMQTPNEPGRQPDPPDKDREDDIPDSPPTEPERAPIQEPPPSPDQPQGPFIVE